MQCARWRAALVTLVACVVVLSATSGRAETVAWDGVERVVAIGDVHGAYQEFVTLLSGIGLIDAAHDWQGGATHMVNVGDLLDRGADSRKVMDLLMRLQPQAQAVGGRVHLVLGNHELMNLTGDLRDVSAGEIAAFGSPEAHRAAFSLGGKYGKWLLAQPAAIRINDSLFLHGGVSRVFGDSVDALNKRFRAQLKSVKRLGEGLIRREIIAPDSNLMNIEFDSADNGTPQLLEKAAADPLFGENGPLWYRGNAACHPLLERPALTGHLRQLGVARVVVGHTPTSSREIESRFDGLVYVVDTGMLAKVYKGQPRALEITASGVRPLTPQGPGRIDSAEAREQRIADVLASGTLEQTSDNGWQVRDGRTAVRVERVTGKKQRRRLQAVHALDRWFGFGFVPVTVAREVDGKTVVLVHEPSRLPEARRTVGRPNYCEVGSDFHLVAVFDALLGKHDRDGQTLAYNPRTWEIILIGNANAFAAHMGAPTYAQAPVLTESVRERLRGLSTDSVRSAMGDLLTSREVKALLKRRDEILAWHTATPAAR